VSLTSSFVHFLLSGTSGDVFSLVRTINASRSPSRLPENARQFFMSLPGIVSNGAQEVCRKVHL